MAEAEWGDGAHATWGDSSVADQAWGVVAPPAGEEVTPPERVVRPASLQAMVDARREQIHALAEVNLAITRARAAEVSARIARRDLDEIVMRIRECDAAAARAQTRSRRAQLDYVGTLVEFLCATQAPDQLFCDDLFLVTQVASMARPESEVLEAITRINRFASGLQEYFEQEYHREGYGDARATIEEGIDRLGLPWRIWRQGMNTDRSDDTSVDTTAATTAIRQESSVDWSGVT